MSTDTKQNPKVFWSMCLSGLTYVLGIWVWNIIFAAQFADLWDFCPGKKQEKNLVEVTNLIHTRKLD